jgi:hypothetical protein
MVLSYKNAVIVLPRFWWCLSGLNVMAILMFFSIFDDIQLKQGLSDIFLLVIAIGAVLGLAQGLYIMFRAKFTSLCSIVVPMYMILTVEIIFFGSGAALAMLLAGRIDLRWFAFNTNVVCVLLALFSGMFVGAERLGLFKREDRWRGEIEKFLDYSKHTVMPVLTTNPSKMSYNDAIWIGAIGTVNIPLLFQIYGGGRDNAIFLAAPLAILASSYMNFKTFGPGLTRIFLLRKIEKEQGYRFQNADYEKIQELRRGFFLSRLLMKDYRLPIVATTLAKSDKQTMKKLKYRHKE